MGPDSTTNPGLNNPRSGFPCPCCWTVCLHCIACTRHAQIEVARCAMVKLVISRQIAGHANVTARRPCVLHGDAHVYSFVSEEHKISNEEII
jgi:hypothetical protein